MKKLLVILMLLAVLLSGCASSDPAYVSANITNEPDVNVTNDPLNVNVTNDPLTVTVDDSTPVDVTVSSGEVSTLPHDLEAIHEGVVYMCSYLVDLASQASCTILLILPDVSDNYSHLRYSISTEAETTFYLFENTATSANGTAIATWNRNRTSANIAETLVYHTPTIDDDGTQIQINKVGAEKKAGGAALQAWRYHRHRVPGADTGEATHRIQGMRIRAGRDRGRAGRSRVGMRRSGGTYRERRTPCRTKILRHAEPMPGNGTGHGRPASR